jgi:hypothetical protein
MVEDLLADVVEEEAIICVAVIASVEVEVLEFPTLGIFEPN